MEWTKLLFPLLTGVFIFIIILALKKDKTNAPEQNPHRDALIKYFRTPTSSESDMVKEYLLPRLKKLLTVSNIIFFLIDAFFLMVFYSNFDPSDIVSSVTFGLLIFAALGIHFVFTRAYLILYNNVRKDDFTVSPCRIVDKNIFYRTAKSNSASCCLTVRDTGGNEEIHTVKNAVYDAVSEGDECLVVRYSHEDDLKNGMRSRDIVPYIRA